MVTCTDNDVDIVDGSLATITNQLEQGFSASTWEGDGIVSGAAATDGTHLTTVGAIQNNQNGSPLFSSNNLFDGTNPGASDVLVKYTYYGDANLDGKVDGSDYSRIDNGYLTKATGWFNGDFNYDQVVNGSDYTLIDNAFNSQGTSLAAATAAARPASLFSRLPVRPADICRAAPQDESFWRADATTESASVATQIFDDGTDGLLPNGLVR